MAQALANFWDLIDAQLDELRSAQSAEDVARILGADRNPYGDDYPYASAPAFFGGGGGDVLPSAPLREAGWRMVWAEARYHWCMEAPNGDRITYVEGDVYLHDTREGVDA